MPEVAWLVQSYHPAKGIKWSTCSHGDNILPMNVCQDSQATVHVQQPYMRPTELMNQYTKVPNMEAFGMRANKCLL